MKTRKIQTVKKKRQRKYAKRISLYPLKPEEALSAFMKVNPEKIMGAEHKTKKKRLKD